MKIYKIKIVMTALFMFLLSLFLSQCGGVGAPSFPIEIPSVLKFVNPEDLTVDFSSSTGGANLSVSKAPLTPGENIAGLIDVGVGVYEDFNKEILFPTLKGLEKIEIPVEKTRTNFEANINFGEDIAGFFSGIKNVFLDFAAFDYDNDDEKENCSGNTLELPICVRFWIGGAPFLAGIFDKFPISDDPNIADTIGKGRFKIIIEDPKEGGIKNFAYIYEEKTNEKSKDIEFFLNQTNFDSLWDLHVAIMEKGPKETALKQLNFYSDGQIEMRTPSFTTKEIYLVKYIGQFVEGGGYWSGSVDVTPTFMKNDEILFSGQEVQTNMCAAIPSGDFIDYGAQECSDVGDQHINILVEDIEFIRPPEAEDTAFPEDFFDTPPVL